MQLLRRILAGLVIALVALLPGASHALSVSGTPRPAAQHGAAGAHAAGPAVHDHRAAAGCAGHHHGRHGDGQGAPPCHLPCKACAMACCAPAIVDLSVPVPTEMRRLVLLRRFVPSADRRYADASSPQRLRPPIHL